MRHLLNWKDQPDTVWSRCLESTLHHHTARDWPETALHKALGLLFFNPSLRTRTSMEVAAARLGAHSSTVTPGQGVWGFAWDDKPMTGDEAEHVREAVGVLCRYFDAVGIRVFADFADEAADLSDARLHMLAKHATSPIINLESAAFHPCQGLADAATMAHLFDGDVQGKKFVLTWAPHPKRLPRAVPHSALLAATRLGMDVTLAHPTDFDLGADVVAQAEAYAAAHGASLTRTDDQDAALDGADVVYAKAWGGSLGYDDVEAEAAARAAHADWTVTADKMARTRDAAFMHCLPVRRGVVVDADVLEGPHAQHLLQAEMRIAAQMAILEHVWEL